MGLLVFGISPLIFATGAGAVARQTIGFTVLGGMQASEGQFNNLLNDPVAKHLNVYSL